MAQELISGMLAVCAVIYLVQFHVQPVCGMYSFESVCDVNPQKLQVHEYENGSFQFIFMMNYLESERFTIAFDETVDMDHVFWRDGNWTEDCVVHFDPSHYRLNVRHVTGNLYAAQFAIQYVRQSDNRYFTLAIRSSDGTVLCATHFLLEVRYPPRLLECHAQVTGLSCSISESKPPGFATCYLEKQPLRKTLIDPTSNSSSLTYFLTYPTSVSNLAVHCCAESDVFSRQMSDCNDTTHKVNINHTNWQPASTSTEHASFDTTDELDNHETSSRPLLLKTPSPHPPSTIRSGTVVKIEHKSSCTCIQASDVLLILSLVAVRFAVCLGTV